ncbi:hypothetical protein RSOLAG1IB_12266 [Rhizoctonia solani AG-1 IB]|uniref:Uncharacterized protein n=1 Tax=Thanatephorus cucumeris (strain AG1-IB / isolate 7/3/14) TaxID=1108050 RepID=A0A0B7FQL0_THACB|nr:hypothetical protein RSOLAG1IB_12266 [Rhizoctonia solani AG-1 IB]
MSIFVRAHPFFSGLFLAIPSFITLHSGRELNWDLVKRPSCEPLLAVGRPRSTLAASRLRGFPQTYGSGSQHITQPRMSAHRLSNVYDYVILFTTIVGHLSACLCKVTPRA